MKTNEFPKEIYAEVTDEYGDEDDPFALNYFETIEGAASLETKKIGVDRLVEFQEVRLIVSRKVVAKKVK